jgi:PIN domain nuclease of toxin-antitoxin system
MRLGSQAALALQDPGNDLLLSAATIWELAIKAGLGKLSLSAPYRQWISQAMTDLRATVVPITVEYADVQAALPHHHRDPFDRMLIAQSQVENIPVVSNDPTFDAYGVSRVW